MRSRAVTSGLSSFGMPTHTTVAPLAPIRSITSPTRVRYSAVQSASSETGSDTMNVPSSTASPWESLPPNVATTMSGSTSGSFASSSAGQSKKSGRARPDDTL